MTKIKNSLLTGLACIGLGLYGNFLLSSSQSTSTNNTTSTVIEPIKTNESPSPLEKLITKDGYEIQVPQDTPDITIVHYGQAHRIDNPMVNSILELARLRHQGKRDSPEHDELYSALVTAYSLVDISQRSIGNELSELYQLPNAASILFTEELSPAKTGSTIDPKSEKEQRDFLEPYLLYGLFEKIDRSNLHAEEEEEYDSHFSYFIGIDSKLAMKGFTVVKADVESKHIDGKTVYGDDNIVMPDDRSSYDNPFDSYRDTIAIETIVKTIEEQNITLPVVVPLLYGQWHDFSRAVNDVNNEGKYSVELIKYNPALFSDEKLTKLLDDSAEILMKYK